MADNEIENAIALVNKRFGKGTVKKLGDDRTYLDIKTIPTGSVVLDMILGVGGMPLGRTIELYGIESGGKTSVALHVIAEVQKEGGVAVFIDAEHALDKELAKAYGVDTDNLLINQPDTGEEAIDVAEALVRTGKVQLVVIDSVAAMIPQAELESEMADQHMGLQARMMGKALRKLTSAASQNECTIIFINQIREKIGGYGNFEVTPGGRALKFYATIRIDIRRADFIKRNSAVVGHVIKMKVTKNKVAVPYKVGEVDLIYGEGFDNKAEVATLAVDSELVSRSGAWYTYIDDKGEEHKWMGKDNVKLGLHENLNIYEEIKAKVLGEKQVVKEELEEEKD